MLTLGLNGLYHELWLFSNFSVAEQSGSCEITICTYNLIPYVYTLQEQPEPDISGQWPLCEYGLLL